jgi:hypothetical protein
VSTTSITRPLAASTLTQVQQDIAAFDEAAQQGAEVLGEYLYMRMRYGYIPTVAQNARVLAQDYPDIPAAREDDSERYVPE